MTAFVESRVIAFAGIGWIEREKEHPPCSAEALLYSRRMPSFAESFRREDDKITAVFCDDVAAFLFAWAHKGADSGSAVEVNARHSLEPFINLREHLKGVMTGRLRIAVLP